MEIGAIEAGKKVHRYVRQLLPGVPLSGIHKMLRTGRVKINGKKAKSEDTLSLGDKVQLYIAEEDFQDVSKNTKKFSGLRSDIDVVYEDDRILVVNKPTGLLTHGDKVEQKDTLVNRVLAYLYRSGTNGEPRFTPAPANRLDRNTSGLVVFGKTGEAMRHLARDIAEHRVRKWYLAVVDGKLTGAGEIATKLSRDSVRNRTQVHSSGKEAVTLYDPICSVNSSTLVRIELIHGRTHQIRAHFEAIGHPLVGDVKYGGSRSNNRESNHQWLHAGWIEFMDGLRVMAPLPDDFRRYLSYLGYSESDIHRLTEF